MIEKDRVLVRSETTLFRVDGAGTSGKAFDQTKDMLFEFDEVSTDILKLVNGTNTVNDIISTLSTNYDVPENEIEADVISFLEQMIESGVMA